MKTDMHIYLYTMYFSSYICVYIDMHQVSCLAFEFLGSLVNKVTLGIWIVVKEYKDTVGVYLFSM